MKIKINRFMLAYEGKLYEAGDIVDIKDSRLAKRLVAGSKGDMEICGSDYQAVIDDDSIAGTVEELPDADPSAAIENKKKVKA